MWAIKKESEKARLLGISRTVCCQNSKQTQFCLVSYAGLSEKENKVHEVFLKVHIWIAVSFVGCYKLPSS